MRKWFLFLFLNTINLYAEDINNIIENYNRYCESIFEKKSFKEFINILNTSDLKKSYIDRRVCEKIFKSKVYNFDKKNKKIEKINFKNNFIKGEFVIVLCSQINLLLLKPMNFSRLDSEYTRQIDGLLLLFNDNFYFIGKWKHSRGTKKQYQRVSSIIKYSNSLKLKSMLQFNFTREVDDKIEYRYIYPVKKNVVLLKDFYKFNNKSFLYYINLLNKKNYIDFYESVMEPIRKEEILLISGNVFFTTKLPHEKK